MSPTATCHFCGEVFPLKIEPRRALPRVTSDCRPAVRTGPLVVCPECCLTQTVVAPDWRNAAEDAYREYAIYEASGGAEQKVVSSEGLRGRSEVITDRLATGHNLAGVGTLLDFGCGNGGFLSSFAERFPGWTLDGAETDARHLELLRTIAGFRELWGTDIAELPAGYDVISLIHVLEHLEEPSTALAALHEKANSGAALVIEVPSWRRNPFALMISDHASHFTAATLWNVVGASGWAPTAVHEDWVPKELSLVARKDGAPASPRCLDFVEESAHLRAAVRWLASVMDEARRIASESTNFGLFGSAIAASWLYQGVADRVRFFVDEDPQRIGRTHLGMPILAPDQVPSGADVFVGVSPVVAGAVLERLRGGVGRYHAIKDADASGVAVHC